MTKWASILLCLVLACETPVEPDPNDAPGAETVAVGQDLSDGGLVSVEQPGESSEVDEPEPPPPPDVPMGETFPFMTADQESFFTLRLAWANEDIDDLEGALVEGQLQRCAGQGLGDSGICQQAICDIQRDMIRLRVAAYEDVFRSVVEDLGIVVSPADWMLFYQRQREYRFRRQELLESRGCM